MEKFTIAVRCKGELIPVSSFKHGGKGICDNVQQRVQDFINERKENLIALNNCDFTIYGRALVKGIHRLRSFKGRTRQGQIIRFGI
jgi:hypothetical protein